jgi:hypothetical protein
MSSTMRHGQGGRDGSECRIVEEEEGSECAMAVSGCVSKENSQEWNRTE